MIHFGVIGEAGAVLGSAWLVQRFHLFQFGEDAGQVADLLRQMRLRALRGEGPPATPSIAEASTPPE